MKTMRRLFSLASLFILVSLGAPPPASAAVSAVSFDGTNDYVTFGAAPGLGAPTFTIETWFRRTGAGVATSTGTGGVTAIPLVAKGRAEADGTTQDMNYFLGIRTSDNVLVADFEEGAAGTTPGLNHPIAGVTTIFNNVWYHAAVSYDGATWRLYLNGAFESQLAVGKPPRADSIQHAALGTALNSTGVASGFLLGSLDEVRIWNHARTAQDIADNKNIEITASPGLIGRWGLNEGGGTLATDSSGSAINGALTNGPLWTAGFDPGTSLVITRGPYLQMGTATGVLVRWRTNVATDSRVQFGVSPAALTGVANDAVLTTEHQVALTGLSPDTQYYYSAGSSTATLATGTEFTFFTAPPIGTAHPTRIWVLGDSGTGTISQTLVRDAFHSYNGTRYTDLWLMLGDNVYETGTDAEYQSRLFDIYPTTLRQSVLWPAVGNHDTAGLTNPPLTIPYFQSFTMPMAGEAGGVPSGTEKYYSFDYGRVHFICLDSQTSSRAPGGAMAVWLLADLNATTQDWIIAYWHHPPYSKGSHDSDAAGHSSEMRVNFLPILEAGGVDLLLFGHSHNYERSFLLDGHYGLSTTFTTAMKLNGGSGREDGAGAYVKPVGLSANQGAVYIVAGTSGKLGGWTGGGGEFPVSPHPAMFYSAQHLGSMVLDVDGGRLDVKMIRETGAVDDYFTLLKAVPNTPPTVSVASPADGATFPAPADIQLTASASDAGGFVVQVDFYTGTTLLGTDTSAPFSVVWNSVAAGSYALTALATDSLGATTMSAAVNITVTSPPPGAPAGLSATAGNAQVALVWSASSGADSYRVKRATASGGSYAMLASGLTVTDFTDVTAGNGTTYFYIVTAIGLGGESVNSNEVSATPMAAPNTPPSVGITSPANGATFTALASIPITASAADVGGSVARVDFYAGATLIGSDISAPFSVVWNNVAAGSYALTATATDDLGAATTSDAVGITVISPITVSFQDGVNAYTGTRDTQILTNSANTNYGASTTLTADGSPDTATLIKWDLSAIPSGRQVTAATLTFNVTNATSHTYGLYASVRAWAETTATWNRASTGVNWQVAGANGSADRGSTVLGVLTSTTTGLKTFTLNAAGRAQVQAWINAPATNNGFVILDYSVTDGLGMSSSEAGTINSRPKITITHQ